MALNKFVRHGFMSIMGLCFLTAISCKRNQDMPRDVPLRKKVSLPNASSSESTSSSDGKRSAELTIGSCDGIEIASECRKIESIGRCHRDGIDELRLRSFMYPTQTAECSSSGFAVDEYPYFKAVSTGAILLNRWIKVLADGIFVIYLNEGESPNALDGGYKFDGPGFRVVSELEAKGLNGFVPLFRCGAVCQNAESVCDKSLSWFSLDASCEGQGKNLSTVGWVIKP